jgi:uncharacterized cupin superfamily protein
VQGNLVESETFNSSEVTQATDFFSNDVINLGTAAPYTVRGVLHTDAKVEVTLSTTVDTGGYYGADFTVGETPCYAEGSLILTPDGERPVETLAAGDRLVTRAGRHARVAWVGHRRVRRASPVRIAANAFGPGQPLRDLILSPDHAVFVDGDGEDAAPGVLIPIRHLVNGTTIQPEKTEEITYWHVELERHDILLAEGLPCESYLDTGNRAAFANGGAIAHLHPDFSEHMWEAKACAELVVTGPRLEAVRQRLNARTAIEPAIRAA